MAAKKRSLLSKEIRRHLEDALLEALKRHLGRKAERSRKKKAPVRNKKAGKKKISKKKPVRRRKRGT